jgi:hypothetical protein
MPSFRTRQGNLSNIQNTVFLLSVQFGFSNQDNQLYSESLYNGAIISISNEKWDIRERFSGFRFAFVKEKKWV